MAQAQGYDSDNSVERQHRREGFDHELIQSEEEYYNILSGLIEGVYLPLLKFHNKVKIPEQSLKKVFHYLEQMKEFHDQFLKNIREQERVLDTFSQTSKFATMYEQYAYEYSDILDEFSKWQSMEFREFVTLQLQTISKATNKAIDERLSNLPWYLYRPFDRITEYYRYLKDLKKLSRPHDSDINDKDLNTVIKEVKKVYAHIKRREDKFQAKTTLMEVQLQIHGIRNDIKLVNDQRYFIYNRRCQMRRKMIGKKYKKIHIYLFNDLFIWVSERGKFKGSYSFYDPGLEIKECGKVGDATFSIGRKDEKHPREIVCLDDVNRNQLMEKIKKTYLICLKKVQKAKTAEIQALRKKTQSETVMNEEMSETSVDRSFDDLSISNSNSDVYVHKPHQYTKMMDLAMNPINENAEESKSALDTPSHISSKSKRGFQRSLEPPQSSKNKKNNQSSKPGGSVQIALKPLSPIHNDNNNMMNGNNNHNNNNYHRKNYQTTGMNEHRNNNQNKHSSVITPISMASDMDDDKMYKHKNNNGHPGNHNNITNNNNNNNNHMNGHINGGMPNGVNSHVPPSVSSMSQRNSLSSSRETNQTNNTITTFNSYANDHPYHGKGIVYEDSFNGNINNGIHDNHNHIHSNNNNNNNNNNYHNHNHNNNNNNVMNHNYNSDSNNNKYHGSGGIGVSVTANGSSNGHSHHHNHNYSHGQNGHGRNRSQSQDEKTHSDNNNNNNNNSHGLKDRTNKHGKDKKHKDHKHSSHKDHSNHSGHSGSRKKGHSSHSGHGHSSSRKKDHSSHSGRKHNNHSSKQKQKGKGKEKESKTTQNYDESASSDDLINMNKDELIEEILKLRNENNDLSNRIDIKNGTIKDLQRSEVALRDTIRSKDKAIDNLKEENRSLLNRLNPTRQKNPIHNRAASLVTGDRKMRGRQSDTFRNQPFLLDNIIMNPQTLGGQIHSPNSQASQTKSNHRVNISNGQNIPPTLKSTHSNGSYHSNNSNGHSGLTRGGTESQLNVNNNNNNNNNKKRYIVIYAYYEYEYS